MKTVSFYLQVIPLTFMLLTGLFSQKIELMAFVAFLIAFFGGAYQLLHTVFWVIAKHKLNLHQHAVLRVYVWSVGFYFLLGIGLLLASNFVQLHEYTDAIYMLLAAPLYLFHTYFSYCLAYEKQAFSSGNKFLNNIQL